jgi:hypothetical protein
LTFIAVKFALAETSQSPKRLLGMQYKGLQYSVAQTATGWKWIVRLDDGRTKTGTAPSRAVAIRFAEKRIEKALEKRFSRDLARASR